MILENLPEFLKQSPLIPLMFSVLLLIIVLLQCMTKHIFYKVRLIFAFLLTFASALFLIFFDELRGWIEKSNGEINSLFGKYGQFGNIAEVVKYVDFFK